MNRAQHAFAQAARRSELSFTPDCGQGESREGSGGCPIVGEHVPTVRTADCPVISQDFDLRSLLPNLATASPLQESHEGYRHDLDPPDTMSNSEQIIYSAMRRRDWLPTRHDVNSIASIHNNLTERAWNAILNWEKMHCNTCKEPKLRKVADAAASFSARFRGLEAHDKRYSRQDWVVSRCGRDVRYIVESYNAALSPNMPVAMHLEVRPALDSAQAIWDRTKLHWSSMQA